MSASRARRSLVSCLALLALTLLVIFSGSLPANRMRAQAGPGITGPTPLLPGVSNSYVFGVSASGYVCGSYAAPSGDRDDFLWSQAGGLVDLGSQGNWQGCILSNSGLLASQTTDPNDGNLNVREWSPERGWVFAPRSAVAPDGSIEGGISMTSPQFINASGVVVAQGTLADGEYRNFIWTPDGGVVEMDRPPNSSDGGIVDGFSDSGQVVIDNGQISQGQVYTWTQAGGYTALGLLTGQDGFLRALGTSATGQIVGIYHNNPTSGDTPISWTAAGGWVALPGHADAQGTSANYVNSQGAIAGMDITPNFATYKLFFQASAAATPVVVGALASNIAVVSGLNGQNQMAGYSYTANYASQDVVTWSAATGLVDLGPGGTAGITSSGLVIVNNNDLAMVYQLAPPAGADTTPPTITLNNPVEGATYAAGSTVAANYACADSQSAVVACAAPAGNGAAVDTSRPGPHTFTVTAVDQYDNIATRTVHYTVPDTVPPVITISAPLDGAGFLSGTAINAAYTCSDETALATCTASDESGNPVANGGALNNAAGGHLLTVRASDQAGNVASQTVSYNVAQAPAAVIASPANGAIYKLGQAVNANYSCIAGYGVAGCSGPIPSGSPLDTSSPGFYSFTVNATDNQGNSAATTTNYIVLQPNAPPVTIPAPPANGFSGPVAIGTGNSQIQALSQTGYAAGFFSTNGGQDAFVWTKAGGMQDIGALAGGNTTVAAVNAQGQVVGSSAADAQNDQHAFSWTAAGGMVDLGVLPIQFGGSAQPGDQYSSQALAVNDNGVVVGASSVARCVPIPNFPIPGYCQSTSQTDAFSWTPATGMVDLGGLGGQQTQALAVNASGQIAGLAQDGAGNTHALIWAGPGQFTDLGPDAFGSFSYATIFLNNLGQIAGANNDGDNGFFWSASTGVVDVGSLGGNGLTQVTGINNLGQLTGYSAPEDNGGYHAFLWTSAQGMTDLGALDNGGSNAFALPTGINDGGQITGFSNVNQNQQQDGFVWQPGVGMLDLGAGNAAAINNQGLIGGYSRDANGNATAAVWQVNPVGGSDTTPPTIHLSAPGNGATYGLGQSVTANYACSDDDSGVATCAGPVANGGAIDTSTPGSYSFTVNATDQAGNAAAVTAQYTVAAPPTVVAISSPVNGATLTQGQPATVGFSCANAFYTVLSCTAADSANQTYSNGGALNTSTLGAQTLSATAVDSSGATVTLTSQFTVVAPASGAHMLGDGAIATPAGDGSMYRFAFNLMERPAASDSHGRFSFWTVDSQNRPRVTDVFDATSVDTVGFLNNPAFNPGGNPPPSFDSVTFTGQGEYNDAPGYTYSVTATDQGEPGTGRDTFQLTIQDGNGNTVFSANGALLSGNIQSSRMPHRLIPFLAGGPPVVAEIEAGSAAGAVYNYPVATATDFNDQPLAVVCAPLSGATLPLGRTHGACSATDALGRTSTIRFRVLVADTTAPVLSGMPANLTLEATAPSGTVVNYTMPTATDTVDPSPHVTCDRASGRNFPLGTTTVTCTARDASGNKATATFSVTVQDTTAPVFTATPANLVAEATSAAGAKVNFAKPQATDAADNSPTVVCAAPSGSTFPLGVTPVTCTATDNSGNASTTSFTVTVGDTTPPTIAVTDPKGSYALNQAVSVSYACSDSGSGVATCAGTLGNGATLDTSAPGTYSFLVSATDLAGNTATKVVNYTVRKK